MIGAAGPAAGRRPALLLRGACARRGPGAPAGERARDVPFYEALDGVPAWFELSVDGHGLVERASMRAQAHFMAHGYYDFDAPLTIAPHAGWARSTRRYADAMPLTAVFFDLGETLVDETELVGGWADWLGVPRLTFFATVGAVLARGALRPQADGDRPVLREVMRLIRPDLDVADAVRRRGGGRQVFSVDDLYPDALPCLLAVRQLGYRVGIAANQPAQADAAVRGSGLPFEWLLISDVAGVSKPDPAFFERILEISGLPASSIAYIGDRVDNDVVPAVRAGMAAVHVRRGPWGVLQAEWPDAALATLRVGSLAELPARLRELGAPPAP